MKITRKNLSSESVKIKVNELVILELTNDYKFLKTTFKL